MRMTQRAFVSLTVVATILMGGAASLLAQETYALPEPVVRIEDGSFYMHYFGDARNVQWTADLLKDGDPLVRERAVTDLGQTDNPLAAGPIRSTLKDPDLGVRCAALAAMAELDPNLARPLVIEALGDGDRTMVLTALRLARSLRLADAGEAARKLLSRNDSLVVSAALETLTSLGLPAPSESLKGFLEGPEAAVRLRAAQNALLAPPATVPIQSLLKIAAADDPQIRACAMAALGKSASAPAEPILAKAAESKDPALRRGALWGWRYAGKTDRIRRFLDDESPMVVLAAIEAAGELKCADCAARLCELMPAAQDDRSHFAARQALLQIGQDAVAQLAAEGLKKSAADISRGPGSSSGPGKPPGPATTVRNVRSFSWLLGQYRSKAGLDVQIDLVRRLTDSGRVDSLALIDLAAALVPEGDERAKEPIRQALGVTARNAPSYLTFKRTGKGEHKPFKEEVTAALVEAAGELKDSEAVPTILRLVAMEDQGVRLSESAAAAARALPLLVGDTNRAAIEQAVLGMLRDKDRYAHGMECTFEACKAAAKLKLAAAVPLLKEVLSDEDTGHKRNRQSIHASAWAIGQLTGKVPPLPEPLRYQGPWTVRAVE